VRETKIEYPEKLVAAETAERLSELEESLDREGLTLAEYRAREGLDEAALMRRLRAESKRAIAVLLVIDTLAKENAIELRDEDLEESVWTLAQSAHMGFTEMWETLDRTGQLDEMRRRMLRTRVCDFVLEQIGVDEREMTYEELLKGDWLPDVPDEVEEDEPTEGAEAPEAGATDGDAEPEPSEEAPVEDLSEEASGVSESGAERISECDAEPEPTEEAPVEADPKEDA